MIKRSPGWRLGMVAISLAILPACGGRGALQLDPDAGKIGTVHTVYVGTSRRPEGQSNYSSQRADEVQYSRMRVSIPPDRELGTVKFPNKNKPNPKKEFLLVSAEKLKSQEQFIREINLDISKIPSKEQQAILFVHGYNTNFAEGLFRHAQIKHDMQDTGISAHFSWPSAGSLEGYLYDRESILYSRDDLEQMIDGLSRSRAKKLTLTAHSMGTLLLMDTLWAMSREPADSRRFEKIERVVLISPDIEIDVFKRQVKPLLARGIPIFLLVSSGDRALRFSARLRGERDRLGSIRDAHELNGLDVKIIDLSKLKSTDLAGHFSAATSPSFIKFIRGVNQSRQHIAADDRRASLLEGSVSLVQDGVNILISPLSLLK